MPGYIFTLILKVRMETVKVYLRPGWSEGLVSVKLAPLHFMADRQTQLTQGRRVAHGNRTLTVNISSTFAFISFFIIFCYNWIKAYVLGNNNTTYCVSLVTHFMDFLFVFVTN